MDTPDRRNAETSIPVLEEEATVSTRTVTKGVTTVDKQVEARDHLVSEMLQHRGASVERVPKGVAVDIEHPPEVRTEDGTTIVPVLEEVLVVEKRLLLKEELHIRHYVDEVPFTQEVTLRNETVVVKHSEDNPSKPD